MKPLTSYLECEGGGGAMPSNTLGAGNPGLVGPSIMSEPLTQGQIGRQPTAKTKVEDPETSKTKKNKKKKHMKDLIKSWKFWAAIIAVLLVIVTVVLCFTVPTFAYATGGLLIGGLAGFIFGYFIG